MTITYEQLIETALNATKLGNTRDSNTLHSLSRNLQFWGSLTSGQIRYAEALIARNSTGMVTERDEEEEGFKTKWLEDDAYREWIIFLAKFFAHSAQTAYWTHIDNRRRHARRVLSAFQENKTPVANDCRLLEKSKLAPKLRDTFDNPPIYPLGELVQVRASELCWVDTRNGLDKEMGFIIEVDAEPVTAAFTYHKSKGGSREYRIMFPSGELVYRENQIKLVSRKNRGKK